MTTSTVAERVTAANWDVLTMVRIAPSLVPNAPQLECGRCTPRVTLILPPVPNGELPPGFVPPPHVCVGLSGRAR